MSPDEVGAALIAALGGPPTQAAPPAEATEASGDGPVDAIFGAIREAVGSDAELRRYSVEAVTDSGSPNWA